MARIKIVDPAQATDKSKELLTALQNSIKSVPNLAKVLANSPAALKAWMEPTRIAPTQACSACSLITKVDWSTDLFIQVVLS
jgi:hypothetical protein